MEGMFAAIHLHIHDPSKMIDGRITVKREIIFKDRHWSIEHPIYVRDNIYLLIVSLSIHVEDTNQYV